MYKDAERKTKTTPPHGAVGKTVQTSMKQQSPLNLLRTVWIEKNKPCFFILMVQ